MLKLKWLKSFKKNGGVGFNISALRPAKSVVQTSKGYSCGAIGFMEEFDLTADIITRNNARKGAIKVDLNDWHPDIFEFVSCKDSLNKFNRMNISVSMSDKFMNAVKNNSDWELKFPDYENMDKELYHSKWHGDMDLWEESGYPVKIYQTVKAKELYNTIMEHAWKTGEPGVSFRDVMDKDNPNPHLGKINSTNPCFTGDMRLLTENGYKTFEELCDTQVNVVNKDNNITPSKVWCSGEKEVVELSFNGKNKIKCTPNHVFMLTDGTECEAKDLLHKRVMPQMGNTNLSMNNFVKFGFIQGDGNLTRLTSTTHKGLEINIGKNDYDIFELFNLKPENKRSFYLNDFNDALINLGFDAKCLYERDFPNSFDEWSNSKQLDFLKGCYSANGCVNGKHRISYKTTSEKFASKLFLTLNKYGITPNITINKPKKVQFSNGEYNCKMSYDVNINKFNDMLIFYNKIGFVQKYKMEKLVELIKLHAPMVTKITPIGIQKVYDFTEPVTHWGVVEGCVVHNCAEFCSIPYNSCNLGSINLSNFVENKQINYDKLKETIHNAVRFLDDMITVNVLPIDKINKVTKSVRSVGLGTMGFADMLYKMNIIYGSLECNSLIDSLYSFIKNEAQKESIKLAKEKGTYAAYKGSKWDKNNILVRNSNFISIAPNGSISFITNTSGGIEPNFALVYTRLTNDGTKYFVVNPVLEEWLKQHDMYNDEILNKIVENNGKRINEIPGYFLTAQDISPDIHVDVVSQVQKYVDLSVSKTVNLPNNANVNDVSDIYMKAWKSGVKGITIYRDGSRENQTLSTSTNNNKEEIQKVKKEEIPRGVIIDADDNVIGLKRKLITGCGSLHCEAFFDPVSGDLLETYFNKGSTGGCNQFMIGLSRTISLLCRAGVDINTIIEQLNSCGVCPSYATRTATKHDTSKGACCPMAIGNALLDMYKEMQDRLFDNDSEQIDVVKTTKPKSLCPECGEPLIFEGGCNICKSCGWSKCN